MKRKIHAIPRPEYPRPQFSRKEWMNLNGYWTYEFDQGISGVERGLNESRGFSNRILVPFCPESALSGVKHTDFIRAMWYHKSVRIPSAWKNKRILIHFGGADYECELFVDGKSAGIHYGGTVSFSMDLTAFVTPGKKHDLVVRIKDDINNSAGRYPLGKQSVGFASKGCHYTRTTGIWQTVWMEPVAMNALKSVHILPDLDGSKFTVIPAYYTGAGKFTLTVRLLDGKRLVVEKTLPASNGGAVVLHMPSPRPWSPEDPHLYNFIFEMKNAAGRIMDVVESYAGLRKVHIEGNRIFLNNKPVYLRLVLDQGFYPAGIWTAPSDRALKRDIELSMAAGFNGARLHQKVFEERFHYWADKLGYLTWGESASWGCNINLPEAAHNILSEWREIILRDRNHPSIIAWTPFNETSEFNNPVQHYKTEVAAYELSKALDSTRPVNDASGYIHHKTDLWTVHNYEQNPAKLREILALKHGEIWKNFPNIEPVYGGQPYLVDEYGGTRWVADRKIPRTAKSWGYGSDPRTTKEFLSRVKGLTDAILSTKHASGYCYTQLTDVEQEQNGIYNYNRSKKFDMKRVAAIFSRNPPCFST